MRDLARRAGLLPAMLRQNRHGSAKDNVSPKRKPEPKERTRATVAKAAKVPKRVVEARV